MIEPEPELELAYDPRDRHDTILEPPRGSARTWSILVLGLVLVASFDVLRLVLGATMAPRAQDWQAAETAVRRNFSPGDLIVAAPAWADPMMRIHLGDLVPPPVAARPNLDRYGRVWEVTIRGKTAPETAPPAQCQIMLEGRVRVRRCDRPHAQVLYDLVDHLEQASIVLVRDGKELPCTFRNDRVSCPGLEVHAGIGEVDYQPRRCLKVFPSLSSDLLRLIWPSLPAGGRLVVEAGIHSFYSRKNAQGPVDVDVALSGKSLGHFTLVNDSGWHRVDFDTAGRQGDPRRLRIELASPQPQERSVCLAGEVQQ